MPRKPIREKKIISVIINGQAIAVTLHPPIGSRKSWYAYWRGLVASKSTGHADMQAAILAAETMLRSWKAGSSGARATLADAIMSDDEFNEIQRVHFTKAQDTAAQRRSEKTHKIYTEASTAFRLITGLKPITAATADDCAKFQRDALTHSKNWRQQHPKSRKAVDCISPNTVLKWSRSLQAAFERANRGAGRKCVRGVVLEAKLLNENPWNQFTWIPGRARPIRQFSNEELISFLDYLEREWRGVSVGAALAKAFLWSRCRLEGLTTLKWDAYRPFGGERHFCVVEKQGIVWWFRLPEQLYCELQQMRSTNDHVFAIYSEQLRAFHAASLRPKRMTMVGSEFKPQCLGDWFYDRLADWSAIFGKAHAHPHVFRKTSLQLAWDGDDGKRQAIDDARVGERVLKMHYILPTDRERREESNRNYFRIVTSLPAEVALRYGHVESCTNDLAAQLKQAIAAEEWTVVNQLSAELANRQTSSVNRIGP